MAIFARRKLQQFINNNAAFMSTEQVERHVRHLNTTNPDLVISSEWEVVLLYAFSRLGRVLHEPDLGGGKFADIQFFPIISPETPLLLEITAVSDKGFEVENNVEVFERELKKRIHNRIKSGSFFHEVKFKRDFNRYSSSKAVARLPKPQDFNTEIFNNKFKEFLNSIITAPAQSHAYVIDTDTTGVAIRYSPGENTWTSLGVSYRKATSIKNNAIWNALNAKRQKLKKINHPGLQGIILCDGGCEMLYSNMGSPPRFPIATVIGEFLKKHASIHFVVTLATVQFDTWRYPTVEDRPSHIIEMKAYFNKHFPSDISGITEILEKLYEHLPIPDSSCEGVRLNLENGYSYKIGKSHRGGFTQGGNEFRMSLRDLFEYLSGTLPEQTGLNSYGPDFFREVFDSYRKQKLAIEEIAIENSEGDDNWVTFRFSSTPDPAVSPFTNPLKKKRGSK